MNPFIKSAFDIVTVISLISDKILHTEIVSKDSRECHLMRQIQGTNEFDEWWKIPSGLVLCWVFWIYGFLEDPLKNIH